MLSVLRKPPEAVRRYTIIVSLERQRTYAGKADVRQAVPNKNHSA
jgi:hypothetical protein